jgi:hypothetical protein
LGLWFGLLLFLLWPFGCGFVWFGWLILLSVWLVEIGFGRLGSARLSFAWVSCFSLFLRISSFGLKAFKGWCFFFKKNEKPFQRMLVLLVANY